MVPLASTKVPVGDGICIYCCIIKKKPQPTNELKANEFTINFFLSDPATAGSLITQTVLSSPASTDTTGHAVAFCDIKSRLLVFSPHLAETSGSSIRKAVVCNGENGEYSEVYKEFNPFFCQNTKTSSFHKGRK